MDNKQNVKQNYLGDRGLIVFLALLSGFVPLSTDLYLPALPLMARYFQVPEYQVNLTLILFFVFYAAATLIWGPLSDKYGRRPVLMIGLTGYALASAMCMLAASNTQLIIFRILQAVGGGVATTLATAIVKDVFDSKRRESILAIVQSMVVISPAVAPVIGALLLKFTSWRGIFAAQMILGIALVLGSVMFRETLATKSKGGVWQAMGRLGVVLKNPRFAMLLIIFSMIGITSLAYISSSSYIFQNTFGLSSQVYSYFFAFNAIGMLVGPLFYLRLAARFKRFAIINACFATLILSGFFVWTLGGSGPWVFAIVLLPATIASACIRPPGTFLMLEQQKGDTGSAASLIGSAATVMGSAGMILISLNLNHPIKAVGALNMIFGALCGGLWLVVTKGKLLRQLRGG
ncbi:MAG: multidrug effflux MFS transporter [Peptococcaceae bacterium]|jgi:DHA1 family bicyclomycin/chloramphenicol resistance-like MFS transporter|nr:multidrug effflux MFS transporter [Peptococcaceae bacterium]